MDRLAINTPLPVNGLPVDRISTGVSGVADLSLILAGAEPSIGGLIMRPFQRNLVPYPSLKQSWVDANEKTVAKNWGSYISATGTVNYSVSAAGQHIAGTGLNGYAQINTYGYLAVVDAAVTSASADRVTVGDIVAAQVTVSNFAATNGGTAFINMYESPGFTLLGEATIAGDGKLFLPINTPLPIDTTGIYISVGIKGTNATISCDFSDACLSRNWRAPGGVSGANWYWEGSKPYVRTPALDGGVGCTVLTDGKVVRSDAYAHIMQRDINMDLTQAWWGAIEYIPNFNHDDHDRIPVTGKTVEAALDNDSFNIRDTTTFYGQLGIYQQNDAWKAGAGVDFALNDPRLAQGANPFVRGWWYGGDVNHRLHSPSLPDFHAGDSIKEVMAFIPEGTASDLAPGHHIWGNVNGGEWVHASNGVVTPPVGAENILDEAKYMIAFSIPSSIETWDNTGYDTDFGSDGLYRHWYISQQALDSGILAMLKTNMASVGWQNLPGGCYFPLTGSNIVGQR